MPVSSSTETSRLSNVNWLVLSNLGSGILNTVIVWDDSGFNPSTLNSTTYTHIYFSFSGRKSAVERTGGSVPFAEGSFPSTISNKPPVEPSQSIHTP